MDILKFFRNGARKADKLDHDLARVIFLMEGIQREAHETRKILERIEKSMEKK